MIEEEWLAGREPLALFNHLRGPARSYPSRWFPWAGMHASRISLRKGLLFVCAALEHDPSLSGERARSLARLAEDWADCWEAGSEPTTGSQGLAARLAEAVRPGRDSEELIELALHVLQPWMSIETLMLRWLVGDLAGPWCCDLLRELFGNPFHPVVIDPAWLGAREGLALTLARQLHQDRAFAELPVLADALEEAGCADAPLLTHLRGPGPHRRGCWALDLVLGKS